MTFPPAIVILGPARYTGVMDQVTKQNLRELVVSPLAWASYAAWVAVWLASSSIFAGSGAFSVLPDGLLFAWLAGWIACLLDDLWPPPGRDAALASLAVLTALALWFIPNGTTPILLILLAIQFTNRFDGPRLAIALIAANAYFAAIMLGPWQQSFQSSFLTLLAMSGFQVFAVMVMIYANRSHRLAEDLQAVNARLLATRSLLGETARDHERLRLSRELHDVAGHKVTALKLNLRGLARHLDGEAAAEVDKATGLADELLQDLRSVVRHLRETEGIDLVESLREVARPFPRPRLKAEVDDDARIPRADQGRQTHPAGKRADRHARAPGRTGRHAGGVEIRARRRQTDRHLTAGAGPMSTRIALADDQTLIREGLKAVINDLPDMAVVVEAASGEPLLDALEDESVDLVVSDIRMPGIDGIELCRRLKERDKAPPVLLLTTFDDSKLMLAAVEAGAQGFALKDISPEDLADLIAAVVRGEGRLQPVNTSGVAERYPYQDDQPPVDAFSEREIDILRLIAGGYSNREIARAVHLAEGTVKNYVSDILDKLNTRDRTRAVLKAITLQII
jgi:DNA-binding NarL/FixJ family response regulator/signal transduction histidine kinase